jgi:putative Ca2+/H+ antiporter (TMEM165/GDT1 family)
MNIKMLLTVFTTVFLAELADKTQIATLLFASDKEMSKLGVFIAAASALVLSTAIAVAVGGAASHLLNKRVLSIIAGTGFIIIGVLTLIQGIRAA